MSAAETTPEQKKILQLYGAFGAALAISLVPSMVAAMLSLILFSGAMIAAYVVRSGAEDGDLTSNHMTFIIRTMWIGSFFASFTIGAGSAYLLLNHNSAPLDLCAQDLMNNLQAMQDMDIASKLIEGCVEEYWKANKVVLLISGALSAGPILVYFLMRYTRGISRALGGYRVSNPKGWF